MKPLKFSFIVIVNGNLLWVFFQSLLFISKRSVLFSNCCHRGIFVYYFIKKWDFLHLSTLYVWSNKRTCHFSSFNCQLSSSKVLMAWIMSNGFRNGGHNYCMYWYGYIQCLLKLWNFWNRRRCRGKYVAFCYFDL